MVSSVTADSARYCYLDLDLNDTRQKLAVAAAFVNATDTRYGFTSSDLRCLGGSELARIPDLLASDHEWSGRTCLIKPPTAGNRIVVELFWDVAPLACENFATLCCGGSSITSGKQVAPPTGACGKPLTYQGSVIHRVIPEFIIQGGDFVFGNGSGGESIYGKKFKDERGGLALKHDKAGTLSMGNSGKNSNTSQFFMTFQSAPQCDGKHVVFGRVVSGWGVLEAAEALGTTTGEPTASIVITDCGIFKPLSTPGAGYWYDQPDAETYSGISPVFMVRPRVAIVAPTAAVADKFVKALGEHCVTTVVQEDSQDETRIVDQVSDLLKYFAIDVVLVAPACKRIISGNVMLDPSWSEHATEPVTLEQVLLEAKPIDALAMIRTESWLVNQTPWQLDGTMQ